MTCSTARAPAACAIPPPDASPQPSALPSPEPPASKRPRRAVPTALSDFVRARIAFDHLGERTVHIPFEAHGPRAASASIPPIVVLGGISASRHLAPTPADPSRGWWRGVVDQGGALDPARSLLIGVEYLGGTTESGHLRPVTSRDQARAVAAVLDELGHPVASLVGASYGGMVALAFAELFPARVARLAVVCAAHRTHPMATGIRSVQRAAATLGRDCGQPARGLALARALGMTTYRTPEEFDRRFAPEAISPGEPGRGPARFPVEDYLNARGEAFARTFDVERFVALSESVDLHSSRPEALPSRALLVSFDTDTLVPSWLVDELAARSGRCSRHVTVRTLFGHDAFLKEVDAVGALLEKALVAPEEDR